MTNRLRTLVSAANAVEQRFNRLRFETKKRLGFLDPFEILPYLISREAVPGIRARSSAPH